MLFEAANIRSIARFEAQSFESDSMRVQIVSDVVTLAITEQEMPNRTIASNILNPIDRVITTDPVVPRVA